MPDEPGATSPGEPTPDEAGDTTADQATVAISALAPDAAAEAAKADEKDAAAPDETQALPPAPAGPDEEVVTLPIPTASDEGVTLPIPAASDEGVTSPIPTASSESVTSPIPAASDEGVTSPIPTASSESVTSPIPTAPDEGVTMPIPAAPDEATVALSASARPREAAAEAAPVAAAATAASAPAGTPVTLPGGITLTRRQLLIGLSGVAGVGLVGGAVALHSATDGADEKPIRPLSASPAVTRPRTPESTTVATPTAPVQHRPIYTLAEYRKAARAAPFPADSIALTIDDGPHPIWTPKILRLLDKYHVPAIFCMIGNQVLGHENVAQMVTRAGHQLANHTYSHPTHLAKKPRALLQKEIQRAQTKIQKTTGYAPKLFRSPGGDWSPQLLHEVAKAGMLPLDWSVDPRDWSRPGVNAIERRLLAAHPGQILLCHDGGGDRSQTYKSLSVVIPTLKARGLHFAALQG